MLLGLTSAIIPTVNAATYEPSHLPGNQVTPRTGDVVNLNSTLYTYSADENQELVPFSSYSSQGRRPANQPEHITDQEKTFKSTAYIYRLGDDVHVPAYSTITVCGWISIGAKKANFNAAQDIFVNVLTEIETSQTIRSLYLGQHTNRSGDYVQKITDISGEYIFVDYDEVEGVYDNSQNGSEASPDLYFVGWASGNKPGVLNSKYALYTGKSDIFERNWCRVDICAVTNYIYYDLCGGVGTAKNTTKDSKESITIAEAPTRTGYTFAGWNTKRDGSGTTYTPGQTFGENSGLYLYAQWIPNKYDVTVISDICVASVNQNPATFGTKVTLTTQIPTGYQIDSIEVYKTDNSSVTVPFSSNSFTQPEYPVTIKITASKILFAIEKYPTTNGSFTVSHESAGINDIITITPTPNEGFEIDTITVTRTDTMENLTVTDNAFTMVTSPIRVAVTFKNSIYGITKAPTVNGSFTIEQSSTIFGDTVIVNAVADDGYRVKSIKVYKTGQESTTVTVTGNSFTMPAFPVTVEVEFELKPYEIFKSAYISSGNLTISHTEAYIGDTVSIETTAANGYILDAITVYKTDDESVTVDVAGGSCIMPGFAVTVHATFKKIDYTISVTDASGEKGSFTVDKTIAQIDDTVTITVTCAEGWTIRGIMLTDSLGNVTFVDTVFSMPADNIAVSVSYMVIPTYLVTIPATVELGGAPMTITITDAVMEEGVNLKVSIETDFIARTAEGAEKEFSINGGTVESGDVVLTVDGGGTPQAPKSGSASLSLEWDESYQYSGNYRATLSFTIKVEDEGYNQNE